MSIQSIDSQIMIARTAEMSRDVSAMQKKTDVAQEFLAVRERINDEQDQSRVAKTPQSEKSELRPGEEGGGGGGAYSGSPGEKKRDGTSGGGDGGANLLVPAGDSIIDIRV